MTTLRWFVSGLWLVVAVLVALPLSVVSGPPFLLALWLMEKANDANILFLREWVSDQDEQERQGREVTSANP